MKTISAGLLFTLVFFLFGCGTKSYDYPYQDPDLPVQERVEDLISRMTLEEKVSQMIDQADSVGKLGIPMYNWWNECLHGVGRAGIATVFPQAIGLAATWNTELMYHTADIISTEARAKHHEFVRNGDRGRYKGLTFWSPNINIFRDPRWGRGQETYGEDPFLTARMGVAFVKGLQGNDPKYLKVVSTPKHYAVHSGPEPIRHSFDAITDMRDLYDTYLPAFKATVVEGGAFSVMGAYNRYLGQACCAHDLLLEKILRDDWGFQGYVVSDCGAIYDIHHFHKLVETEAEAAAFAVKKGCDLNCGNTYLSLLEAVEKGYITEEDIDVSVKRLFTARFLLGMFDPPGMVPFTNTPFEMNDASEHAEAALRVARESMVLLKNSAPGNSTEGAILPLSKKLEKIAVIGPNADNVDVLLGNYNGTPSNPVNTLEGIREKVAGNASVEFVQGCNLVGDDMVLERIPPDYFSSGSDTGFTGEYFDNQKLEGEPRLTRNDREIFFIRGEGNAFGDLPSENFSVRWTATFKPPVPGEYVLSVTADDGYRLFINNDTIIDSWSVYGLSSARSTYTFVEDKEYQFRLEYFQRAWNAEVKLEWGLPGSNSFQDAVDLAASSDVAIFVGGISPRLEGEEMRVTYEGFKGGDRTNLELPAIQKKLIQAIHATGTPTVLVLNSGSALAVNWEDANLPAILLAWYPGQAGGTAIADVLFGDYNPAGRLPVTFYRSVNDLPPFENYAMEGRTYRYFRGNPLYPFGYGLSFTRFDYKELGLSAEELRIGDTLEVRVILENVGDRKGDEVVQLYVTDKESATPVPLKALKGFQRISLEAGEEKQVIFTILPEDLAVLDDNETPFFEEGSFELMVGGNSTAGITKTFRLVNNQ